MNLIDAVKSGRPFRRQAHAEDGGWLYPARVYSYELDDILADDYEIQEPEVRITRAQFWEAVSIAEKLFWPNPAAHVLARRLGLEAE